MEVILVDDGSTDESGKICDEYAAAYSLFTVIHIENAGVANARNMGIDASHGQYIMFIDGDDFIAPQMIEILFSIHSKDKDCISCCDMVEFQNGEDIVFNADVINVESYDINVFAESMFSFPRKIAYPSTVTCKLFPKELIGERRFRKTICEDNVFNTEVIINQCRLVKFTNAKLYAYRRHDNSTMAQLDNVGKKFVDRCNVQYLIYQLLPKENAYARGLNLSYLHFRLLYSRYQVKQHHTKNSDEYHYAQRVLKDLRRKTIKDFVTNKYIPWGKKISYLLYESFPKLYSLKLLIDYRLFHKYS